MFPVGLTDMWPLREYNYSIVNINAKALLRFCFLFVLPMLALWGFGYDTVGERLRTHLAGVVVSSKDVLVSGRRGTEYVVRGSMVKINSTQLEQPTPRCHEACP